MKVTFRSAGAVVLCLTLAVLFTANAYGQTRYVSPTNMAALPFSYGVVFDKSFPVTTFYVTPEGVSSTKGAEGKGKAAATGDLKAQMEKALANLDAELARIGSTKLDVLRLNVEFVGKSFKETFLLSELIQSFFVNRSTNPEVKALPVRSMVGFQKLDDPDVLVRLIASVPDPAHHTTMSKFMGRPDGPKAFMIGGITAIQKDYTIRGMGDMRAQMRESLANLDRAMTAAGVNKGQIQKVTVWYAPASRASTTGGNQFVQQAESDKVMLESALKDYFGPTAPKVEVQEVLVACDAAIALQIEVEGTADRISQ
jgi:enamine deaminase RidA (YjgF/YER057c/UK114 family)